MKELQVDQYPGLPKWPAVLVTGKSVTVEQAKDIIFRTDTSVRYPSTYMGGNDDRFHKYCQQVFGWQLLLQLENAWFDIREDSLRQQVNQMLPETLWDVREKWCQEMQMVGTEYVYNSWLSSAYIHGPTGWVSPTGAVSVNGHNYGKWPSVEEIMADWRALATAFPYIDLVCTLYSAEASEDFAEPVCSIVVKDGEAKAFTPDLSLHDNVTMTSRFDDMRHIMRMLRGNFTNEQAWPKDWIAEFGERSTAAMQKAAPWLTQDFVRKVQQFVSQHRSA